ncbi:MAG TPA: hypothetical protein VKB38_00880 [Terracidiphilus sp.]|nr:hypothetical protein [Terracidiphilus sp.]
MIDVHPPHKATHSWTDFFIHIATIVVGLLIAIGLEQTVEWVHHRHQLAEIRAALDQERDLDLHAMNLNRGLLARADADLSEDARLLQRRAEGDRSSLAGKLNYEIKGYALHDVAWQTARESAVLALMPDRERQRYAYFYLIIGEYMSPATTFFIQEKRAMAILRDNPGGNFSAEDTRELIDATHQEQAHVAYLEQLTEFIDQSGARDSEEKPAPAPDQAKPATAGQ